MHFLSRQLLLQHVCTAENLGLGAVAHAASSTNATSSSHRLLQELAHDAPLHDWEHGLHIASLTILFIFLAEFFLGLFAFGLDYIKHVLYVGVASSFGFAHWFGCCASSELTSPACGLQLHSNVANFFIVSISLILELTISGQSGMLSDAPTSANSPMSCLAHVICDTCDSLILRPTITQTPNQLPTTRNNSRSSHCSAHDLALCACRARVRRLVEEAWQ